MLKKLLANLIVLALLAAAVFLVGWLPLRVKPGQFAVVVSKTSGIMAEPLRPGQFYWTAEALLPTNLRLYSFAPVSQERRISHEGELPSAALYRDFLAGQPDFRWEISLRLAASLKPDFLPQLVSQHGVEDNEGLAAWLYDELQRAGEDLRSELVRAAADAEQVRDLVSGRLAEGFGAVLARTRPHLDILEVSVVSARAPDLAVYEAARRLYADYLTSYQASIEPALVAGSVGLAEDQLRMTSLRNYGELLKEYPILIDFLAIEAGLPARAAP